MIDVTLITTYDLLIALFILIVIKGSNYHLQ